MFTATITGRLYEFSKKTTSSGKEYIAITVVSSRKDSAGKWISDYYNTSCWSSSKNYNETWELLKTLQAGKPKAKASRVCITCIPYISEHTKTKEKILAYNFLRLEAETTENYDNDTDDAAPF